MLPFARRHIRLAFATVAVVGLAAACSSGGQTAVLEATSVAGPASTEAATSPSTASPSTTGVVATTLPSATTAPVAPTVAVPADDVFPGSDWATAGFPADADRAALDTAVDTAFGAPDSQARVRSIVVVEGGKVVYERYHPLDGPEIVMTSYSVAKSFTSAVIGLLVGDGKLVVDDPAPVAAWADPTDPRHAITLENLLQMSSGLDWTEEYGPGSQPLDMIAASVASDYVASFPLEAAPGTKWEYSTGTTAILAGIITDTLGGPEQADTYIQERLLDPIGITSTQFLRDGSGRWLGGLGADSTSRDFARFGLLFLNDGVWDGARVLPEGWVDYSQTPSATNPQYGAQWWLLRPDAFEARGLFGQIIMVSPIHDLVIVINTTQGGDADTLIAAAYEALAPA